MNDTDFHWLRRRLPLCYCGAGPAPLDNDIPVIHYVDVNDDGTFYVRWRCDARHNLVSYSVDLHRSNPPLTRPPKITKGTIKFAALAIFGDETS